jgi:hypothetical protein
VPLLYKLVIHCLGSSIGNLVALNHFLSMYTFCTKLGDLSISFTSWLT